MRKVRFFAADRICGRTCGSGTGTARPAAGGSRATRGGHGGRSARNGTWDTVPLKASFFPIPQAALLMANNVLYISLSVAGYRRPVEVGCPHAWRKENSPGRGG